MFHPNRSGQAGPDPHSGLISTFLPVYQLVQLQADENIEQGLTRNEQCSDIKKKKRGDCPQFEGLLSARGDVITVAEFSGAKLRSKGHQPRCFPS